jgi:hypothetical protein
MDADKLRGFMNHIGGIKASVPGTGMSSGGLWGAMSAQHETIVSLRKSAAGFAAEYGKRSRDKTKIETLANEAEGHLQALRSLSVIDDNQFDSLMSELHSLKNT